MSSSPAPATSSDLLSASAAIMVYPGRLMGLTVLTDGTNAATVTIYDNASAASGLVLAKLIVPGATSSVAQRLPDFGVVANNGIYASISGTGAACIVLFDRG